MATTENREHSPRGAWWIAMCAAIAAAWLLATAASASEIYRTVDEHGNPMFTDQPPDDDAQAEPLGDIIIVQPPPRRQRTQERTADTGQGGEEAPGYEGVRIVFPPAEEATRRVTGEVPVRVELAPEGRELAAGHRVRIYVDGRSEGEAPATEVTVGPLIPGPHQLRAAVVNADGQTLVESSEILFYLIRQTVN